MRAKQRKRVVMGIRQKKQAPTQQQKQPRKRRARRDLSTRDEDRRSNLAARRLCGGGMQPLTDIGIDPAGNVWVADNWQRPQSCFAPYASEATSTRCGGNGLTVFYGMAKPVRAPQIGPARAASSSIP